MIKKISGLLLARAIALVLLLLFNFLLVKYLTVDEVGVYYLIATISYLGNAVVFVGADLLLQKKIAPDIQSGSFNKRAFIDFLLKTSLLGSGIVFVFSLFIFKFLNVNFVESVVVCVLLTMTTYVTSLLRNLYQTAGKSLISSSIQLADTILKLLTIVLCIWFQAFTAQILFLSYLILSFVLLILLLIILFRTHTDIQSPHYFESYTTLGKQIFPIGGAGLLNWAQLQSYRPFLSVVQHNFAALGTISFLMNLGSTATNAIMTVISQLFLPRIYATKGRNTQQYLIVIALAGLLLALLSLPCGWLFLTIANKQEMMVGLYLIPVGVLQEAINSMIGALTIHYTVKSYRLSIFPICTLVGTILMLCLLLIIYLFSLPILFTIAVAILLSQFFVICTLLWSSINSKILISP